MYHTHCVLLGCRPVLLFSNQLFKQPSFNNSKPLQKRVRLRYTTACTHIHSQPPICCCSWGGGGSCSSSQTLIHIIFFHPSEQNPAMPPCLCPKTLSVPIPFIIRCCCCCTDTLKLNHPSCTHTHKTHTDTHMHYSCTSVSAAVRRASVLIAAATGSINCS